MITQTRNSKSSWDEQSLLGSLATCEQQRLLRLTAGKATTADLLWAQPWRLLELNNQQVADPWQVEVLRARKTNWLICGARGSGKTSVVAAMVFVTAVLNGQFAVVLSASELQALELYRRFKTMYQAFPASPGEVMVTQAEFENGGRIVVKPASERSTRGYHGASLLVLDEAARIPDEIFAGVIPSISMAHGRIVAMSTPFGKRGWFWNEWEQSTEDSESRWTPAYVPWQKCPRITPRMVEDYRSMTDALAGELGVAQEYECRFLDQTAGSPFDLSRWESMCDSEAHLIDS